MISRRQQQRFALHDHADLGYYNVLSEKGHIDNGALSCRCRMQAVQEARIAYKKRCRLRIGGRSYALRIENDEICVWMLVLQERDGEAPCTKAGNSMPAG